MDCSPPDSSVHGILQARILEWVAMPSLQMIFLTQGLNPGLLYCKQIKLNGYSQIPSLIPFLLGWRGRGVLGSRTSDIKQTWGQLINNSSIKKNKLLPSVTTWMDLQGIKLSEISQTAAAKPLQSCPTLCDPMDGSPPGSAVPGILQARTLEWVAISFSSAWKWKVKVKSLSRVWLLATAWTAALQAPLSMGFSRQEYWSGLPLPKDKYYMISLTCWIEEGKKKRTNKAIKKQTHRYKLVAVRG